MRRFSWSFYVFLIFALAAGISGNFSASAWAGNNAGGAFSLWPDTGQTKCYDDSGEIPCPAPGEPFFGQDAQYQGPPRSYTKLGYGGVELPDTATQADGWIMTRDNVTGLIWEIKTDDGSIHDKDNTYTWCDTNSTTNGGYQGTCGAGSDTEDFIAALNAAHFGGYSDWRLPTIKELSTLVNSNIPHPGPTIDTAYFPNTKSSGYWSSTTYAEEERLVGAWFVAFEAGVVFLAPKGDDLYVRAVRGGQKHSKNRFIDNHDGTITDTATGLIWQKCSMGQSYNPVTNDCDGSPGTYTWQAALAACEDLVFVGYDDWRLPDRNEVQSIVDYSRYAPAIDTNYFSGWWSWSSTTIAGDANYAWHIRTFDVDLGLSKNSSSYVRCVRSGQNGPSDHLVISGRVVDFDTGAAIDGASIVLNGGNKTSSNSNGEFSFEDLGAGTYTISVTKAGYHAFNDEITVTPGITQNIVVRLVPDKGLPAIIDVSADYEGVFIEGVSCPNTYTVKVDWAGSPGVVMFSANGLTYYEQGTVEGGSHVFDMGFDFDADHSLTGNTITIVAVNADGVESEPVFIQPVIVKSPEWAFALGVFDGQKWGSESIYRFSLGFQYPQEPFRAIVDVPGWFPFIGGHRLGITDTQAEALAYFQSNREGGVELKGTLGFEAAGQAIIGSLGGGGDIEYVPGEGLVWTGASLNLGLSGKISKEIGVVEVIPPLSGLNNIPGIKWFNKKAKVKGEISPGIDFGLNLINKDNEIVFDSFEGTSKIGIKVALPIEIVRNIKASLYGGGEASLTMQFPKDPGYLKAIEALLYAGLKINLWLFDENVTARHVWTYPETADALSSGRQTKGTSAFHPVQPEFLRYGEYNRIVSPAGARMPMSMESGTSEAMVIENVYKYSEPAIVEHNGDLTIAYVYYDPDDPILQNTEIFTTTYDGVSFSMPTAIMDDTRAEFNPQLAVDSSGNIVAVWERVKATDFNSTEISDMAAQMEIVYSVSRSGNWSEPVALTNNGYLDHQPLLLQAGNGSLMLIWEANTGNELVPTLSSPDTIYYATWDGSGWSTPQVAFFGLSNAFKFDGSYWGTGAILVWTQDMDGNLSTLNDQEIFYGRYGSTGWGDPIRLTDNNVSDCSPKVVGTDDANIFLLWLHDNEVVRLTDFGSGSFETVRPESTEAGLTDFQIALDNHDHLVLLWSAQDENGTDIFYSAFDPVHNMWGHDNRLTSDKDVEKFFHPVFTSDGSLLVVYNKAQTLFVTKEIDVGGKIVQINNVPEEGRNDLYLLTYRLAEDLSFASGQISVSDQDFLPGSTVTLSAVIKNTGDMGLSGVEAAFYDGDPQAGGTMIGDKVSLPGVIEAGGIYTVETAWVIPDDGRSHVIFVLVDPDDIISERDEFNNVITKTFMLADLNYAGGRAEWIGQDKVQLVARVRNSGASIAKDITLEFFDPTGTLIHTANLTALGPGLTTEVGYLWPVNHDVFSGCQAAISVRINSGRVVEEKDYSNNDGLILVVKDPTITFCSLDSDMDGDVDGIDLAALASMIQSGENVDLRLVAAGFGKNTY